LPLTSEPTPNAGDEAGLHAKSYDAKCLRCGAMNIPENHVCGNCGASLPLVYDRDGNYTLGPRNPEAASRLKLVPLRRPISPGQAGWFLRVGIILFAIVVAYILMHRK
jgi:hypothetical protein